MLVPVVDACMVTGWTGVTGTSAAVMMMTMFMSVPAGAGAAATGAGAIRGDRRALGAGADKDNAHSFKASVAGAVKSTECCGPGISVRRFDKKHCALRYSVVSDHDEP